MLKGSVANSVFTCLLPLSCKSSGLQNQPLKVIATAPKWYPKRLYSKLATDPGILPQSQTAAGLLNHCRELTADISRSTSQTGNTLSQGIKHAVGTGCRIADNQADWGLKC